MQHESKMQPSRPRSRDFNPRVVGESQLQCVYLLNGQGQSQKFYAVRASLTMHLVQKVPNH